jgi:hypothetical protein
MWIIVKAKNEPEERGYAVHDENEASFLKAARLFGKQCMPRGAGGAASSGRGATERIVIAGRAANKPVPQASKSALQHRAKGRWLRAKRSVKPSALLPQP